MFLLNQVNKFKKFTRNITNVSKSFLLKSTSANENNLKLSKNEHKNDSDKTSENSSKSAHEFKPSLRFIQFYYKSDKSRKLRIGIVSSCGGRYVEFPLNKCFNGSMIQFMQTDMNSKQILKYTKSLKPNDVTDNIILLPPIINPEKIICVSNNYRNEGLVQNTKAIFFSKFGNALIGPRNDIQIPSLNDKINFAINLAVIIGKTGQNICKHNVDDHIFGYTIAQDITSMYWLNNQLLISKSMNTFCPLGPCILHKTAIKNPHNLELSCKVNGQLKQVGNTNDMILTIEEIVSDLSEHFTLKPGDIILTGSPARLCDNNKDKSITYLRHGDCILSEIQHIGKLLNNVLYTK